MSNMRRRTVLGGLAAVSLAAPALVRAQSTSKAVRIGLISDMSSGFKDHGGPGNRVAMELAVTDFGGSVLGRPIEILQADGLNKSDVAAGIAREWFDDGVDTIADGAATSSGLGMQQIARDKKRTYLVTGPASSDFTGSACSPYSTHWSYDTYSIGVGTATPLTKAGGSTWFFITADYSFGYALEGDTAGAVQRAGGIVLGSVRVPVGTSDFAGYLLKAKSSGAKVIALASAGGDMLNCVKQAAEFKISGGGQKVVPLLIQISDVISLGQNVCQGLAFTDSFYWDMSDAARAWSQRYMAKMKTPPCVLHAGNYAAATHWLKAVKAAGSSDAGAVAEQMKATPVNDFYNKNVKIRQDGQVLHTMCLWDIKAPSEAGYQYDLCKLLSKTPGEEAFRPMNEDGCPFIKA
jgi:branched-chain amino acid transport system substrate-binding protein